MGSLNPENEPKQELDDSGYVQEEGSTKVVSSVAVGKSSPNLLDLSDDVLLYILQYCSPTDLKALGFTCGRLGTLVLDRSLWRHVDARGTCAARGRIRWLLTHALGAHTTTLKLTGYAKEANGCLGFANGCKFDPASTYTSNFQSIMEEGYKCYVMADNLLAQRYHWTGPRPAAGGMPWNTSECSSHRGSQGGASPRCDNERTDPLCSGPQVTFTRASLRRLTALCSNLTTLALEYVVIDCSTTNICMFPQTLRVLSLVGTKCFNEEKSFRCKIQDHLINLEELDVSECEWVEPSWMLPLSKMPRLARLSMRLCPKLTEFVAYASLATRYGFKQLRVLDLRQSPVGDSEVSALGWLPLLEELYLSPAPAHAPRATHAHLARDHHSTPTPTTTTWEEQEPEYYKSKYETEQWIAEENSLPNRSWLQEVARPCVVLHNMNLLSEDHNQPSSSTSDRANEIPIIISKNGVLPPTIVHPGAAVNERDANTKQNVTNEKQDQIRKRKQEKDDTSDMKRRKDESENQNEPFSPNVMDESSDNESCVSNIESKDNSVNDEPASKSTNSNEPMSLYVPTSSNEPTFSNESTSKTFRFSKSLNERTTGNKKDTQAIGYRKHLPKMTPKHRLDNFKKRTENVDTTDDSFDSDDDPSFDDDSPQSKRCRLSETVSTTESDSGTCQNDSKRSTNSEHKERDPKNKPDISKDPNSSHSRQDYEMEKLCPESNSSSLLKRYDNPSNQSPPETEQHSKTPRFVTFRRNKPPIFMNQPAVRSGNQVVIGGCYPQVVVGERPAMEGCNRPPVVVVSGDNQPSVVVRCGENHTPVTSCNHRQQSVLMGNGNQLALVIGCGNQSSVASCNHNQQSATSNGDNQPAIVGCGNQAPTSCSHNQQPATSSGDNQPAIVVGCGNQAPAGCSHNQQSATSSGDNQPAIVIGCGNQAPASCSHNQASVVVGCSHNQPAIVVGCSHNQPAVITGDNRPAVMVGCSHHDDNQNIHNNNDVQQPDWNNRLNMQGLNLDGQRQGTSRTIAQFPSDDNAPTENAAPVQGNAAPVQGNAAPAQGNSAPVQGNAAPENAINDLYRTLYISMGHLRHAMHQISMPDPIDMVEYRVTDSAINRFGRADGENVNYVHIGPMGLQPQIDQIGPHSRPNRSNLRILSVTGFRQITNNSLIHLATAAPYLQSVDFTGTRVTESGVEHFRNFRPECRVRYGPIDSPTEVCGRPLSR